jgi:methylglutaconyl-CoA hydratase
MIETKFENNIFRIMLNRPEKLNAFNTEMIAAATEAVHATPHEARAVLFTGNGKSFCAGADVGYMRQQAEFSEDENREDAKRLSQMFEVIYALPIPTVAFAHGNVFGGGLGILAACDIALTTSDARFCFAEVKLGIIPAVISRFVLRKVNMAFAHRYFLTGELFSSEIAKAAGLISDYHTTAEAAGKLEDLLQALGSAGNMAQRSVKRLLQAAENFEPMSRDQLIHELVKLRTSPDAQARMQAFLQRVK